MLLDDLADRLSSQAVATTGTNLFKAEMPSNPDELIALYETGGGPLVRTMGRGPGNAQAERPHVQLQARSGRPDGARKLAQDAYNALDGLGAVTLNGVLYHSVFALQAPFYLDLDETGRYVYAVNFEIVKAVATSS